MASSGRGSGLAARFRQAVESEAEAAKRREREHAAREAAAVAAATALLGELAAFGRELGFAQVHSDASGVRLRHGGRELVFWSGEAGQVWAGSAEKTDDRYRLYREAALDDRWVMAFRHRGQETRLPLFDQGLEELLVAVLGLPRPGG